MQLATHILLFSLPQLFLSSSQESINNLGGLLSASSNFRKIMEFVSKVVVLLTLLTFLVFVLQLQPVVSVRQQVRAPKIKHRSYSSTKDYLVSKLPGQPKVNFQHYAGYITVNEQNGRALFYWFYEAFSQPEQKPLVLWLNGGPGCSSVGYGATQEIGPFILDTNGKQLKFNLHAWNREANMLFVESPAGVGFSYSNTSNDYDIIEDDFAANDAYAFLHNWFLKFPSYRRHAFYIAGESYAGKYVPVLAELIHDKNKDPSLNINLKGILLGNPETSDPEDWRGMADYAWSHAVISDGTHRIISDTCDFDSNDPWNNTECSHAVDEMLNQYKEIDIYSLYTSVCIDNYTKSENGSPRQVSSKSSSKMMPRIMGGYDPCLDSYTEAFYNRPDVQRALHVSDGHKSRKWSICNYTMFNNWNFTKPSVLPIYKKLIAAGLRIWVYSGDTDGRVPVLSTRYSINALDLPITKTWSPWYHEEQVSGWYQEYQGLTFATFRGAGHAVPLFKRSESLALFASFLQGETLPSARYTD